MKTLNTYINEWKANTNTVSSVKQINIDGFIYEHKKLDCIQLFNYEWSQLKYYKDKIYINGNQAKIYDNGETIVKFEPGTYVFEIKDIDNVDDCRYMFWGCTELVKVPFFNTKKVTTMSGMFYKCLNLIEVPLLDISNVDLMSSMFERCNKLNKKTIKVWSTVYDFEKHCKIEKQ